jgi:hypothetical protein
VQGTPWNIFRYSEDFSNGNWSKGSSTISTNTAIAPNGTLTADSFVSAGSGSCFFSQYFNIVSRTCTISIYIKYVDRQFIQLLYGSLFSSDYANFDILNGVVTAGVNTSASISNIGNGWFRISMTTTGGINLPESYIWAIDSGTSARASTSSGVGSYYVWGAQAVESSSALQYFPTTDRQDVPRIDYSLGGCPTLLMEPQRTNLLTNSEDFSNAVWVKSGATVTANDIIAPNGTLTADKIVFGTSGNFIYQPLGTSATVGLSIYIKGTAGQTISFDDTVNFIPLVTLTGEWQRVTWVSSAVNTKGLAISTSQSATARTIYLWGAQVEAGAYPTSYIPTTTASVTRNQDLASKTGITSLIGQTEGTYFIDATFPMTAAGFSMLISTKYAQNAVEIYRSGVTAGSANIYVEVGGSNVYFTFTVNVITTTGRCKIALAYKSGDTVLYINGVQQASNTNTLTFNQSLDRLDINSRNGADYIEKNNISSVALFKTRLSNSELELLTGDSFDSYAKMAAYFNYTLQ